MRSIIVVLSALLVACTAVLAQGTSTMRTHSISMPYIDDDLQNRWFDFGGNTIINTNSHIRLTQKKQSQLGYLWSRLPLVGDNFQIELEFKVHGNSGHLFGDGFAMWLTKQRMTEGPVFGSTDRFQGLGIFFDTYDNERAHRHTFPYVSSMLGDGMTTYNNDKDGSDTELAGCEADFRGKGFPTRARFTYHKGNYVLLEMLWRQDDQWDVCFKQHDVKLPDQIYLGFSAHTGEVTDNHDIVNVLTKSIPPAIQEAAPQTVKQNKKSSSGGGVLSVLFKMILAGGLVGALYAGYRFYEQKTRMKRF